MLGDPWCESVPFFDAAGDHASSNCPATKAGRAKRHRNIIRVLAAAATEAGLKIQPEPGTYNLLLGEFSKEELPQEGISRV